MTDYYKLLGILPTATTEEVKKAYRQLALKYHPDRNLGDEKSEAFFKRVIEAYSILSDPEARENYNYEYKRSQQTSNDQKHQYKQSESKQEKQVTPQIILSIFQEIRKKVIDSDKNKLNHSAIYHSLTNLLSNSNIKFLLSWTDVKINKQIIEEVIVCCEVLPYPYVEILSAKLAHLAGSDNETIQKIFSFNVCTGP